jgi:hypothetical protein
MTDIPTEPGSLHFAEPTSPLDDQIAEVEEEVKKQRETIAHLAAQGHETIDAQKQLALMLENLVFLVKLRSSST